MTERATSLFASTSSAHQTVRIRNAFVLGVVTTRSHHVPNSAAGCPGTPHIRQPGSLGVRNSTGQTAKSDNCWPAAGCGQKTHYPAAGPLRHAPTPASCSIRQSVALGGRMSRKTPISGSRLPQFGGRNEMTLLRDGIFWFSVTNLDKGLLGDIAPTRYKRRARPACTVGINSSLKIASDGLYSGAGTQPTAPQFRHNDQLDWALLSLREMR